MQLGRYEVTVRDGIGHIRDRISGEVMHPVSDPSQEARLLYVEQARLIERLRDAHEAPNGAPLVVWDVGLGAAANAMAAIHAIESDAGVARAPAGPSGAPRVDQRRLTLVSFENDLDALNLALRHPRWFRHLRHAAPRQLLAQGCWESRAGIDWRLFHGDFAAYKSDAPVPDIIFFDPFSYKTDRELWTLAMFRALAQLCANKPVELFTYSYSTSVRAAMLAAGFFVAKGMGTGPKAETTIALSPCAAALPHRRELLGREWLGKWRRSDARTPFGATPEEQSWREAVSGHPQFQ
jgi:queuine tRNA-ribosyltransferase